MCISWCEAQFAPRWAGPRCMRPSVVPGCGWWTATSCHSSLQVSHTYPLSFCSKLLGVKVCPTEASLGRLWIVRAPFLFLIFDHAGVQLCPLFPPLGLDACSEAVCSLSLDFLLCKSRDDSFHFYYSVKWSKNSHYGLIINWYWREELILLYEIRFVDFKLMCGFQI